MTRASLLHILDHVSAISDSEIRELEQLAAAFPYCQTAHLLLAKAAHDQGSMLASQRLRRAATYAADRQLLRQLIEQPAFSPANSGAEPAVAASASEARPTEAFDMEPQSNVSLPLAAELAREDAEAVPIASEPAVVELPGGFQPADSPADARLPEVAKADISEEAPEVVTLACLPTEAPPEPEPVVEQEEQLSNAEPSGELAKAALSADQLHAAETTQEALTAESNSSEAAILTEASSTREQPLHREESEAEQAPPLFEETASETFAVEPTLLESALEAEIEEKGNTTHSNQGFTLTEDTSLPEVAAEEPLESASDNIVRSKAADDDTLPAVAPPIRPPVEVGSSRFEFGLGLPDPVEQIAYELPTLPEEEEESSESAVAGPAGVVFQGDAQLGYALGGGSRLGYCLQAADDFTRPLPDTEFFTPDALVHEQARRYQPAALPAPSPFDLINKFLRNQPRLRAPAVLAPSADEQADLSVRSTQVVPDIASESLAKIMVRQGKIQKAIEIYERLIVRQPEKKAYFADQIQQLKSTE
jgi:hypothetical protein